jgi:riboflavin transporter FmnP
MMIALSYLFMFLEFPIPALFPPYLKIDPSDIPAVFTGIFIGPIPAIIIELVKNVLHGLFSPKDPNFSGEIANFFFGLAFILPVSIFAQVVKSKLKNWSNTAFMLRFLPFFALSTLLSTFVMALVNYYFTFPLYGMSEHAVKIAGIISVTPFNLFKGTLITIAIFVLYNPLKTLFSRYTK